jgi:hypothetical protein
MYRKSMLIMLVLGGLVWLCFRGVAPARAQDDSPSRNSACRMCHENLYYLYDTGKWYCLCGEQRTCTGCHKGVDDVWEVETAHEGMIANPLEQGAAICQDCHPDDAQVYIEKFAGVAWIDLNATPAPTRTAYVPVTLAAGEEPQTAALQPEPFKPWQKIALGVLGPAFLGVIVFGYKCWQADCKDRRRAT